MVRRTFLQALGALTAVYVAGLPVAASARFGGDIDVPLAAATNDLEGVRKAILDGDSPSITDNSGVPALAYAAKFDNAAMARLLIENGSGVVGRDTLGNMPIHWAAQQGSLAVLQILLDAQSPIDPANREGLTPLMTAARNGQLAAVRFLLEKGADPRKQDFTGRDALGWANQPAIRHLLEDKMK